MADKEIDDFEILPPEGERPVAKTFPQWVAWVMDELFVLPGTKFRFGLDPILGLVPGWGEASASVVSITVLLRSVAEGVPKIVLARMAANILINAGVGVIPVLGDVFSAWFKSNRRNQQLLEKHRRGKKASTKSDWIFVIALLVGILVVFVGIAALAIWLIANLLNEITA